VQNLWQGILISLLTFSLMNVIKVKPHVPPFEKGPEYLETYVTKHKKKINKTEYYSWSTDFMEYAILEGQNAIADSLLAFGYPPDRKLNTTPYALTPLCAAVLTGSEHITQSLLRAGADINILPPDSVGPLLSSSIIAGFQYETIELFLKAGANPNEVSEYGPPPFSIAVEFGEYDIAELLLQYGADVNQIDSRWYNALQHAAANDDLVSVTYLLEKGAKLDTTNGETSTPLYLAIHNGHDNIVMYLLSSGANPDTTLPRDRLPLSMALTMGNYDMVQELLSVGANIEKVDFSKRNFIATVFSSTYLIHQPELQSLMSDLLKDEYEAVVNTVFNEVNMSNLFYMAAVEVIEELRQFENQIHSAQDQDTLARHEQVDIERLLIAIKQCTELFIEYDLNITEPTPYGITVLHLLPEMESQELRQFIIDQFQDVSGPDKYGNTPLHYAVIQDRPGLAKQFIEAGADVNVKNDQDLTALDYAIIEGNTELIELIEGAGGLVGK